LIDYFATEADATVMWQFQPAVVPALVQHPDYANALLSQLGRIHTVEQIERDKAIRAARRAVFRRGGLLASIVLDASVLRRQVGSDKIMRKQWDWLLHLESSSRVSFRVVDGVYDGMEEAFTLFTVAGQVVAFTAKGELMEQVDGARKERFITLFEDFHEHGVSLRDCPVVTAGK
jgi:hypothetical protein